MYTYVWAFGMGETWNMLRLSFTWIFLFILLGWMQSHLNIMCEPHLSVVVRLFIQKNASRTPSFSQSAHNSFRYVFLLSHIQYQIGCSQHFTLFGSIQTCMFLFVPLLSYVHDQLVAYFERTNSWIDARVHSRTERDRFFMCICLRVCRSAALLAKNTREYNTWWYWCVEPVVAAPMMTLCFQCLTGRSSNSSSGRKSKQAD